ncbi:tetratricopeptide repeat protein [candidate division WOR-3 bacterium]|nr:tetratricopeptide repeat protein [candidate division WOR-3 bacterium]
MEYFVSIFVRGLPEEQFYRLAETLEHFSAKIIQAEKDTVIARSTDINILACIYNMKETYAEARFGFSQYIGLARGLSKIANFGEILISEEIEKEIMENFEITSLGMLSIEGMTSQLLVCRIEKPVTDMIFPKTRGAELMILRKMELESIENLLRVTNAVLVIAPDGSGKSVFLDQLVEHLSDKHVFRSVCPAYSIGRTLKPVTDIVTQVLDVHNVESIAERQKKIEQKLKDLEIMDIATSYLAILDFLGLNEEESILEKLEITTRIEIICDRVADVVKRLSWINPVAFVIEDVNNMDPSSITFVKELIERLNEEKVLFILSSWIPQVNIPGLKEYELRPIEKTQLEELIEQVTGEQKTLPPTTPFHVLQYLGVYNEEKMNFHYNQYQGKTTLTNFSLPFHDIKTIIKRRIELLSDEKREFILGLSIAGMELFPNELPIDEKTLYQFDYFVQRGFLVKFLNRYLFSSPLLHEELYNLVEDKQNRHLRLADYYRRIPGYEEEAAFHYLKAENHKKAIEYLMKSAQLAIEKGGYDSGIHYYQQALDLCQRQKDSADLEVLVALNEGLADVYRSLGDEEKALKYYKVVLDSYKEILKE